MMLTSPALLLPLDESSLPDALDANALDAQALAPASLAPNDYPEPLYFACPSAQYRALHREIDAAIRRVLDGHCYIMGEETQLFEAEFAAFTGARHAIGVANGTDAIHLALRAVGIKPGDEVITVAHTAVATVAAIELSGGVPVFVDVSPEHYGMDPDGLAAAITPRTRAILPVHLYGNPVDLGKILEIAQAHRVPVVEDCAQAHAARWRGRQVGSIGRIGCFSLYPTKNLGALGDGGIITTQEPELAERLRMLRQYGWRHSQISEIAGINSRLDEIQAAVLRVKLTHLAQATQRRQQIAQYYDRAFADLDLITPKTHPDCEAVYHLYVIRTPERDALKAWLAQHNIIAGIHYPLPAHRHPVYRERYADVHLPVTERLATEILSLPVYPELSDAQLDRVIQTVRRYWRR